VFVCLPKIVDCSLSPFCYVIVALTSANARISALEAELKTAREAWESANAARFLLRRLLSQQKPRLKKLRKH
jgi:hypothetical protein